MVHEIETAILLFAVHIGIQGGEDCAAGFNAGADVEAATPAAIRYPSEKLAVAEAAFRL